jgi:uncharacterized DUF497 family protein
MAKCVDVFTFVIHFVMIKLVEFDGFDWSLSNIYKVQKHGISIGEIELFFKQEVYWLKDVNHSQNEDRYIAVGKNRMSRPMFVAFTLRVKKDKKYIRVISARFMHREGKELLLYEKLKKSE